MTSQELTIYSLTVGSAGCAAVSFYPGMALLWRRALGRIEAYQQVKVRHASQVLDDLFMEVKPRWLRVAYGVGPILVGLVVFIFVNNFWLAMLGMLFAVALPDAWVRQSRAARRRRFNAQLVDALFILSSSLRAGLSMTQAFEQLEAEMAPPASQEFGLMMKAHRLGLTMEEALQALNERMPSDALNLVTTAVLVGRETGGDITNIISQLVTTIRERKKLQDKVQTLTLQGRLQAYIMSMLPILFAVFVRSTNPGYFDLLLNTHIGNVLILVACSLWAVGIFFLVRLSKVEV